MFKTAQEKVAYELGKIFGRGMAEGYLEKIAEEIEELQEALKAAEPETDVPDFAYESVDESSEVDIAEQLREMILDMTPEQVVTWYNSLDEGTKAVVDEIPEIALIVEQAHAQVSAADALLANMVAEAEEEIPVEEEGEIVEEEGM